MWQHTWPCQQTSPPRAQYHGTAAVRKHGMRAELLTLTSIKQKLGSIEGKAATD
jgi:hypothetical protein